MIFTNIKNEIIKEYKYKIELHAHTTPVSPCSEITPKEIAEIYSDLGYHAIVITNHFISYLKYDMSKDEYINYYLKAYDETVEEAEKLGLKVLLGTEMRFTENSNDYLIYGVDKDIISICYDYFEKGLESFRKEVKLDNSILIQAHPFRDGIVVADERLVDGYEVYNLHPHHNSRNALAVKHFDKCSNLIQTVGSDFHHLNKDHEGTTAIRTKVLPKNSFELAELLRTKDYVFEFCGDDIVLP